MRVIIRLLPLCSFLSLSACTGSSSTTSTQPSYRWMDRAIYFAHADPTDVNRNNTFQKQEIQESIIELEKSTSLGENYFSFAETDESSFNTSLDQNAVSSKQLSFILVWPDSVFNSYLAQTVNGITPDPNAIAVINDSNKREFFIIIRASCIASATVVNANCSGLGADGLKGLVQRQFGLLVGLAVKNCTTYPNDIMCASSPSNSQYGSDSRLRFSAAFNNVLETILNTTGYYGN